MDPAPSTPSTRDPAWYQAYLQDVLEPLAPERALGGLRALVGRIRAQEGAPDIARGLGRARCVQEGWWTEHRDPTGAVPPAVVARGSSARPRWSLPPAVAADVTHERNALFGLWSCSTPRNARVYRWSGGDDAAFRAAMWLLRGTVVDPERSWFLTTRPTGPRHAATFLRRAIDGDAVEGSIVETEDPAAHWGDVPDVPPPDEARGLPEARLFAAVLTCGQHRRVCSAEGGLDRMLRLVRIARCPELRTALRHDDEEMLSSVVAVLLLWDGVCAALELPIRRWLRDRVSEPRMAALGPLWGWSAPTGPIATRDLQEVLDLVRDWARDIFRPRFEAALTSQAPEGADALRRFYVLGQSLRTIGRQLTAAPNDQVATARATLERSLPAVVPRLQQAWTQGRNP